MESGISGLLYFFYALQGSRSPLARLTPAYAISPLRGLGNSANNEIVAADAATVGALCPPLNNSA